MKPVLEALVGRRSFFKSAGLAAAGAGAFGFATERDAEAALGSVQTASKPSELKITDLRAAVIGKAPMTDPIIRIDTNQGISGYGEVRDGASKTYALILKNRLIGENPCNVDRVFRKIKQFGGHARQGGGVCAVEMACWDLAGKAFGVPVYQMLGGRFRDRVRIYADTPEVPAPGRAEGRREAGGEAQGTHGHGHHLPEVDVGIDVVAERPGHAVDPARADRGGARR